MPTRTTISRARRRPAIDDSTADLFGQDPATTPAETLREPHKPPERQGAHGALTVPDSPQAPLTAAQRKFNRLVKRIQQSRAELAAWKDAIEQARADMARRLVPAERELDELRLSVIRRLEAWMQQRRWSVRERDTMIEAICSMTTNLLEGADLDDDTTAELTAVYDRYHDHRYADVQRQEARAVGDMLRAATGIDLPPLDDEALEDYLERAHTRVRQQIDADAAAPPAEPAPQPRARRPGAAAERARLARETAEEQARQSLREVYRKLASALHPDRATDPADARRRTELMQRVNQAHEARDLLTLFTLQLEIEQIDAVHLAQATAERAAHYNHVLTEQDEELRMELLLLREAMGLEFNLPPFGLASPGALKRELDRRVRERQVMLATIRRELAGLHDLAYTKQWVKDTRRMFAEMARGW